MNNEHNALKEGDNLTHIRYGFKLLLVVFIMVFGFSFNAFASTPSILSVSNSNGVSGGQTSVDISINSNSGMIGGSFILSYDDTKLTPKTIVSGAVIPNFLFVPNLAYAKGKIMAVWMGGTTPVTSAGIVCTITFDIKSDAPTGTVSLPLSGVNLKNIDNQSISCTATDGSIAIQNSTPTTKTSLSVTSSSGNSGGKTSVNINVDANSGMIGGSFVLSYDDSKLSPSGIVSGSVIPSFMFIPNLAYAKGKIMAVWLGSTTPVTLAGTVCTIIFDIKQDAPNGATNLALSGVMLKDINNLTIPCITTDGSIVISSSTVKYGDLDGDGKVLASDSLLMKNYLLLKITSFPSADGLKAADVDGDNLITSKDYALIEKFVAGKISEFPIQQNK